MSRNKAYRDGKVHVKARMCETCIFRPGNLMQLEPGRVEEMVDNAKRRDSAIICHKTLGSRGEHAVCRGFYDRHGTIPLRLARIMGNISEVP